MAAENLRYPLEEFYALPEGTHAELIEGIIYNMSPALSIIHQRLSMKISNKIFNYIEKHKGRCEVFSAPSDVHLSENTVVQPDIFVVCDPNKLTDKRCEGAPDWVIEITSGNAANDYVKKLNIYMDYGVREYWIVDPNSELVTVYNFENDILVFKPCKFTDTVTAGIYKNNTQPLEINIASLIG